MSVRAELPGPPKPALFVTCLVDRIYPEVGEAVVKVLVQAGCQPSFDGAQTCCGQPAFNAGYHDQARTVAKKYIEMYERAQAVVMPSGSCASMVKVFYPQLFADDTEWGPRARAVAAKTYELCEYLVDVLGQIDLGAELEGKITYHESCHLSRLLGIRRPPRELLKNIRGITLCPLERADDCCGFGGAFAVKYANISCGIVDLKLAAIAASGADVVVATDMGCLMHIDGALSRQHQPVKVMHIAELLASRKTAEARKAP